MTVADLDHLQERQQAFFESGATRPYEFRVAQLRRLKQAVQANEERIIG